MKKMLGIFTAVTVVLMSSLFAMPFASATDVCSDTPHSSADFYVETSRASWLMSQSCTDSNVVTTMPQGAVMHVIGMTEYWHKLVTEDGQVGWMWVDFVQPTSKTFNVTTVTPDPEPIVEPEPVVYSPMYDISGYKYETAIWYVYNQGIVGGYEDGSYQANRVINRAELLKVIIEAAYDNEFESYSDENCFSDVPAGKWYTPYVCFAKSEGIVQGYADGSFKPAAEINFVEALKIAMIGFGHEYTEGAPWYKDIVELGGIEKVIPIDIKSFSTQFTRGQMAEMITRVMKKQDGLLEDYLGADVYANYNVDYVTIDAGVDVEDLIGTGKCIVDGVIYNDGVTITQDSGCPSCNCNNGDWDCDCINDALEFITYTNEEQSFTLELPGTWTGITENKLPGDTFVIKSTVDEDRYFDIIFYGIENADGMVFDDGQVNTVLLGETEEYAILMRIFDCEIGMPSCAVEDEISWTIQEELNEIPATFTII